LRGSSVELAEVKSLVSEIQSVDPLKIARREQLGEDFHFEEAIDSVRKIVNFFKRIPADFLSDLPDNQVQSVSRHALSSRIF
jgi:hypothetical protein